MTMNVHIPDRNPKSAFDQLPDEPSIKRPEPGQGSWLLITQRGAFWTGAMIGRTSVPHTSVMLEQAKRFETRGSALEVVRTLAGFSVEHIDNI